MSKNTVIPPENEAREQQQRAVVVSAGGAARQNSARNIGLIVGREFTSRVTQRSFVISTIVILCLVVIGACVPTIIQYFVSTSNTQTKMVVVNNAGTIGGLTDDALARFIDTTLNGTTARGTGTNTPARTTSGKAPFTISIQTTDALSSLQKQVKAGSLTILLVLNRSAQQELHFTYYTSSNVTNDSNLSQVQALAGQLNFLDKAFRLGLSPAQTSSLFAQPGFAVVSTTQDQNNRSVSEIIAGYIIAYAGIILIFMSVFLYGMGVATGVAEEKGSRIMEILVNAATPFQLMVGKIVGIGAAGLTQMACFVAVGIGALLLQNPLKSCSFRH